MDAAVAERVRLISEDREHGAGWLARQAVEALAEAVQSGADPLEAGRALARARPAIGAVAGAVGRVLAAGKTDEQLLEQCQALIELRDRAAHSIAALLRPDLDGTVMTHSASATVREALVHAQPPRVVCTVTAPNEEGRPFSEDLSAEGLTVDLVADEDAAHALDTVNLLLLGADSVFRDGSLVNREGTSALAAAARDAEVPVVVACETFKLAPFDPDEAATDEEPFDLTPPDCIDRYVTEEGAFEPDEIAALIDRTPFLREGYEVLRSARAG
jgi:translation initiation factor eIF-2B subunit delta/methylthioribose-1-phosphate isomerase